MSLHCILLVPALYLTEEDDDDDVDLDDPDDGRSMGKMLQMSAKCREFGNEYLEENDLSDPQVWKPFYLENEWSQFVNNRRNITMCILLLSGMTRLHAVVQDKGRSLILMGKAPDIMSKSKLEMLHSVEPDKMKDSDYYLRVKALSDHAAQMKDMFTD